MNQASIVKHMLVEQREADSSLLMLKAKPMLRAEPLKPPEYDSDEDVLESWKDDMSEWLRELDNHNDAEKYPARHLLSLSSTSTIVSVEEFVSLSQTPWQRTRTYHPRQLAVTLLCEFDQYQAYTSIKIPQALGKEWTFTINRMRYTQDRLDMTCSYGLNKYLASVFHMPRDEMVILTLQPYTDTLEGVFLDAILSAGVTTVEALYWNPKLNLGSNDAMLTPLLIRHIEGSACALALDLLFVEGVNLNLQDLDITVNLRIGDTRAIHLDCGQAICLADSESRNYALYAIPLDTTRCFEDAQDVKRYLKTLYKWIAKPGEQPRSIPANALTNVYVSCVSSSDCQCYCWGLDGTSVAAYHMLGSKPRINNFKWSDF